ncbi:MAG: hypothetical protein IPP35_09455 [Elusimicrobia bacterium]|nr:hypothetical protein [Elusimicrobiota bacterium]
MNNRFICLLGLGCMTAISVHAEGFRIYGMSAEAQMKGEASVATARSGDAN